MTFKQFLCGGAAAASLAAGSADAATIKLIDLGGVTGSPAEQGFKVAAAYWGNLFTNDAVINLGVRFAPLPANVIGSTGSRRVDYLWSTYQDQLNASKSSKALDQNLVLPSLNAFGGASFVTNGTDAFGNDDTATRVYDDGDTYSAYVLYTNSATVKAIGGTVNNPGALDGSVTFSSTFAFDFDPSNDVTPGTFDFIGVAIHEIGHALGFVSGVDFLDYYGYPRGPGRGALGYSLNDTSIYSALDMFRYSADPSGVGPGGPVLDLSAGGTAAYFSIDGGATQLFGDSRFSTGSYNGDGRQASHWKDATGANRCGPQLGIMDPTFCFGQTGVVTALDVAAFDAIGWNLNFDVLANPSYQQSTSQILRSYLGIVPEPETWALMIAGFGMAGTALRRQRKTGYATA